MTPVHAAIIEAFREESGKVTATLTRTFGDLDIAEDAVQDAFVTALDHWERLGVPPNPGGWIMTVAKNRALDRLRRNRMLARKYDELAEYTIAQDDDPFQQVDEAADSSIDDDLLRLVFTCCHPALAIEAQVALTLKTLCGLTTPEIARALLVPETTLAQRLVRAKKKIRDAGIPFAVPADSLLGERLDGVLAVVYLVFNEGYSASAGDRIMRVDLSNEALRLGETLARLMPDNGEVQGLLALMLLGDSRRDARQTADGVPVLLDEQDRSRWDQDKIERGLRALAAARQAGALGAYGTQAAIAAVHARSLKAEDTDWRAIVSLYNNLVRLVGSPVVELNRAVAVAMAEGPRRGLEIIDRPGIAGQLEGYRWLHSARADLLRRLGRLDEAAEAYARALSLTENASERAYLGRRLAETGQTRLTGRTP